MISTLFRMLTAGESYESFILLAIGILLWWFLVRYSSSLLMRRKDRPARVIKEAEVAIFLAGALFLFNLVLVPLVLVALGGLAPLILVVCVVVTICYLIKFTSGERAENAPPPPFE